MDRYSARGYDRDYHRDDERRYRGGYDRDDYRRGYGEDRGYGGGYDRSEERGARGYGPAGSGRESGRDYAPPGYDREYRDYERRGRGGGYGGRRYESGDDYGYGRDADDPYDMQRGRGGPGGRGYGDREYGRSGYGGRGYGDYGYNERDFERGGRGYEQGGYGVEGRRSDRGGRGRGSGRGTVTYTYTEYYLVPGPMTGRGPEGYARSNERIEEDLNDRLTQHGEIDASRIQVSVDEGEVTLKGTVSNSRAKQMAEDTAEGVQGVRDVHNRLDVEDDGEDAEGERAQKRSEGPQTSERSKTKGSKSQGRTESKTASDEGSS